MYVYIERLERKKMVPRCPFPSWAGGSQGTKTLRRSCLLVMKSTILPQPLWRTGSRGNLASFLNKLEQSAGCLGRALPTFRFFRQPGLKGPASPQVSISPGRGSRISQLRSGDGVSGPSCLPLNSPWRQPQRRLVLPSLLMPEEDQIGRLAHQP